VTAASPARTAGVAAALALALAPCAARAQQPAPPPAAPPPAAPEVPAPAAPEPVEVVITGSRTPESSQRATVRTRVVTRAEAERRGATNIGEALQGELGVQVNPSAYGARGNPSAIQIQGFDGDRVLVLEDGERVIGDVGGVIDLSSIPLTDASRIELVTGPTSSLYGTSAIGGVVNVISGPPEYQGFSARARVEGQSRWGALLQGSGAYRRDATWVLADASFQYGEGVSLDESRATLALPERSQRLLGVRAGTRLGDVELRVRGRWIHDAQDGVGEKEVPVLGTYLIDLPEVVDRFTLHVDETIHFNGGSNIRFSAGRQWALRKSGSDYRDSPQSDARDSEGVLQSFEGITTLADGSTRTWVLGLRAEVENLEQRLHKVEVSPSGVAEEDVPEVQPTRLGNGAVYGQLAWKLVDELTVMPGIRGEWHLRHGGVLAPRLAAAYRPADEVTIRASGGRGFRAPSPKEIGFELDHSYLGYEVKGSPDLVPEKSWGVNGDVTFTPEKRVTLRVGGFVNWIEDLIDIEPCPRKKPDSEEDNPECLPSASGVEVYRYANIGEARTAGAELVAIVKAASWLRAEVGYAYLWTRDDTHELPLNGRPLHTVHAAIRADLPWSLELSARYRLVTDAFIDNEGEPHYDDCVAAARQAGTDPNSCPLLRTPGFYTIDARIARPLWPSSQAYVGVKNLLGVQKDPDRFADQRPIEGRIFYFGIVAELPWEEEP
jgi:outer membrane receptor for ferrienterochelin and colicins